MDPMISVKPISKKAKNRFVNQMESCEHCIVEQHKGDKVFLRSMNGRNFFWVNVNHDQDWLLEM
jgi:predicted nucleic acid-binding Zn finger protein